MFDRMLWQDNVRDPARTYKATQNADGTVTMEAVKYITLICRMSSR